MIYNVINQYIIKYYRNIILKYHFREFIQRALQNPYF